MAEQIIIAIGREFGRGIRSTPALACAGSRYPKGSSISPQ